MQYVESAVGSMLGPKLLGTYESEIVDIIEELVRNRYDRIIDIGAAEGYYAVGLLRRDKSTWMIAFEATENGQKLLAEMAERNDVSSRLDVRGQCTTADLQISIGNNMEVAIVCDIDGGEYELLDPVRVPALKSCDILVETHDCYNPKITSTLMERFRSTHTIKRVRSAKRRSRDLPSADGFSAREVVKLASEHRPPQEWFWMCVTRTTTAQLGSA
jgi:hypothetical protein